MKYRLATVDDVKQIEELFSRSGVGHPRLEFCFVAEENGKIIGAINAVQLHALEMACENTTASKRLFDMMNGAMVSSGKKMIAYTHHSFVGRLLEYVGFIRHLENITIYTKE